MRTGLWGAMWGRGGGVVAWKGSKDGGGVELEMPPAISSEYFKVNLFLFLNIYKTKSKFGKKGLYCPAVPSNNFNWYINLVVQFP